MDFWKNDDTGYTPVGSKIDSSIDGLAYIKLIKSLLSVDFGHLTKISVSGFVTKDYQYYIDELNKLGGRLLEKEIYETSIRCTFIWNNAICSFAHVNGSKSFNISGYSTNEELALQIKKVIENTTTIPNKKGHIFAIMRNHGNLQLQRIGYAGSELEKNNYSEKIIKDYDYVIKDLKSAQPSGRIAIFDGPPGTGKTYLVRSILTSVPDAMFVLVPPNMVAALSGPELLPMLLQHKETYGKSGPTVFILEDADQCLVPRGPDNIDSISSILNLGDGIFGSLFDVRIIATTNAKKAEMDSAIIRAGRLSKRVEVGKLVYLEANAIFQRLMPGKDLSKYVDVDTDTDMLKPRKFDNKYSLAEVYKAARDAGWEPKSLTDESNENTDEISGYYGDDDDDD